jgi:hypothetical protein
MVLPWCPNRQEMAEEVDQLRSKHGVLRISPAWKVGGAALALIRADVDPGLLASSVRELPSLPASLPGIWPVRGPRARLRRPRLQACESPPATWVDWMITTGGGQDRSTNIPDHGRLWSSLVTACTLQGMARIRSGQAPAWPLVSDRRGCRGSDAQGWVLKIITAKR